jgi:hypothetical protein
MIALSLHPGMIRVLCLALLILCPTDGSRGQAQPDRPPRLEDYPINETFTGSPAAPKLRGTLEQSFASEITDGVVKGYGVFRDHKEQVGPNFAGNMIVIQWGCGAPCTRMVIVDARTGEVYFPPIAATGIGTRSFDLPLLTVGSRYPQNPKVQFRQNSRLMIIKASPWNQRAYTYYFLWQQNRWRLLRRGPLLE